MEIVIRAAVAGGDRQHSGAVARKYTPELSLTVTIPRRG